MATVLVHAPELSGFTGLRLWLYSDAAGTLLNTGGDELTEVANGLFSATVAETIGVTYRADIKNAAGTLTYRTGWIASGGTVVRDEYPTADSSTEILEDIQTRVLLIQAKTQLITAGRIRVVSNVTEGGDITIEQGSDFVGSYVIPYQVPDADGSLRDKLTAESVTAILFGAGQEDDADTIRGTILKADVANSSGITTLPIAISSSNIADAEPSPVDTDIYDYVHHIKIKDADGAHVMLKGRLRVEAERVTG